MQDVLAIVIIFGVVGIVCAVVWAFVVGIYRGSQSSIVWLNNATSPAKSYQATVIGKRTETSGQAGTFGNYHGGYVDTYYFLTFEFKNGERREYEVSGEEFGTTMEGDQGYLTAKGSRFEYFERNN